jgi:aldehyde dehydrogenase (NAD+)
MENLSKFYIDGAWIEPSTRETMPVVNPATEKEIGRVSIGGIDDVNLAVSAARRAFKSFSETSSRERTEVLDRIIAGYKARYSDLVDAITTEIGAPTRFTRHVQVGLALKHLEKARDLLKDYKFEYMLDGDIVRREAFGVCGLITAWNWPLNLVASKIAPALAAGCTMVLKPSEFAPISTVILAEIIHEAKAPRGVFNLVNGTGPIVGQAIASHPDVDLVAFTGSVRGGIEVARAAAPTVKRVHQELGGKSANVVLPDADLAVAIPDAVRRCYINSGQSCIAPSRLLVHQDQLEDVIEIARRSSDSMVVGDPTREETDLGPVANANQFERVQSMIQLGLDEGARLVCGGPGRPNHCNHGYFVRPTIFADVSQSMTIAKDEIFGPVLSILSYKEIEEAIEIANATAYGLAAYVSSGDRSKARHIANRLRAGRIFVNGAPTNATAPFGGYKQSGNGREVGIFGLEEFLEIKAILGDKLDS